MNPEFQVLVQQILQVHGQLQAQALQAVNVSLTLRNACIGSFIDTFLLEGKERATYGENVLGTLAQALQELGVPNTNRRQLYRYLEFHRAYPEIVGTLSAQFPELARSLESARKVRTLSAQSGPGSELLTRLSYSHFETLLDCQDAERRRFYETLCVQGNWSVRELKRQIATLLFERSNASRETVGLVKNVQAQAERQQIQRHLRDPYLFEFVGLKAKDVWTESDLETALIARLQDFLLELGHGFCFEARQKRILMGQEHFFVDLVFYHRVLKCHVLIELKNDQFRHEHLGQLNAYVSYYEQNEKTQGDNPPIGILLCTRKNQELVEYALAGMSNQLFVSRYQVELPAKERLQEFVHQALEEMEDSGPQDESADEQPMDVP